MVERLQRSAVSRVVHDIGRANLGDPRRVARAQTVIGRMAKKPGASLPDAMVTDAELEGAYRLFGNEHVSFEALIEAHALGTAERTSSSKLVLAIHDTTKCAFSHADPEEIGYLNTGKPGFLLHLSLVVDTREWRRPLGIIHAEHLARDTPPTPRQAGAKKSKHRSSHHSSKDPDREFLRWHRGIETAQARLASSTASVIHVADRESDSYALMATCLREGYRFLFRARNNRTALEDGAPVLIRDLIAEDRVVLEREVPLSRRLSSPLPRSRRTHPERERRVARLAFSARKVTFKRPNFVGASMPKTIGVNVLHVFELDAPVGQEPVDWLLYTTEPLETKQQIEAVVDYYRCRWQIEELNKALKTGCVVQQRRLESFDALTTMLALSLPIAVELLALRTLARTDPTSPAELVFHKQELAALRHISHRPLPMNPTVQDVLWCVAGLGGHIKNNGAPGWQVLQRGMEKHKAFAAGWCAAKGINL